MNALDLSPFSNNGEALDARLALVPPSISGKPRLDAATERAVRTFMRHLDGRYATVESFLFGSRARGTAKADSDADLAIVLKGERGDRYKVSGEMAEIAFDELLETDILIDPLPVWEDELHRPEHFGNPALLENLRRDGLRL